MKRFRTVFKRAAASILVAVFLLQSDGISALAEEIGNSSEYAQIGEETVSDVSGGDVSENNEDPGEETDDVSADDVIEDVSGEESFEEDLKNDSEKEHYYWSSEMISGTFTFYSEKDLGKQGSLQLISENGTPLAYNLSTGNTLSWYKSYNSTRYSCQVTLYKEKRIPTGIYNVQYVVGTSDPVLLNAEIEITDEPIVNYSYIYEAYTGYSEAEVSFRIENLKVKPEKINVYITDLFGNRISGNSRLKELYSGSVETSIYFICEMNEPLTYRQTLYPHIEIDGKEPIISCDIESETVYNKSAGVPEIKDIYLSDYASGEVTVQINNAEIGKEYRIQVKKYYDEDTIFFDGDILPDESGKVVFNLTYNGFPVSASVLNNNIRISLINKDTGKEIDSRMLDVDISNGLLNKRLNSTIKQKSGNLFHTTLTFTNCGQDYYALGEAAKYKVQIKKDYKTELDIVDMKKGSLSLKITKTEAGTEYEIGFDVELKSSYQNKDYEYNVYSGDTRLSSYASFSMGVEATTLSFLWLHSYDYTNYEFWSNIGIVPVSFGIWNPGEYESAYLVVKDSGGKEVYKSKKLSGYWGEHDNVFEFDANIPSTVFTDKEKYTFEVLYNGKTYSSEDEKIYTYNSEVKITEQRFGTSVDCIKEGRKTACFVFNINNIRNFTEDTFLPDAGYFDFSFTNKCNQEVISYKSVKAEYNGSQIYVYPQYDKAFSLGAYRYVSYIDIDDEGTIKRTYSDVMAYAYEKDSHPSLFNSDQGLKIYFSEGFDKDSVYTLDVYKDSLLVESGIKISHDHDGYFIIEKDISNLGNYAVVYDGTRYVGGMNYPEPDYEKENRVAYSVKVFAKKQYSYENDELLYRTTTRDIGFRFAAQNYCKVRVSEDKEGLSKIKYSNIQTEPYGIDIPFSLSEGAGEKTVFIQFSDADGNESDISELKLYYDSSDAKIEIVDHSVSPDPSFIMDGSEIVVTVKTSSPFCHAVASFVSPKELPEGSTKGLYFDENGKTFTLSYIGTDDDGNYVFEGSQKVSSKDYYFERFEFDKFHIWLASYDATSFYSTSNTDITEHIIYDFAIAKELTAITITGITDKYGTQYINKLPKTYSGYATANASVTVKLESKSLSEPISITAPVSSVSRFSFTVPDISDGSYTLTATDGKLSLEGSSRTIVVDTVAPKITKFTAVRTDGETDANVTLKWETDSNDVWYYLLWKNNGAVWTESNKKNEKEVILPNYVDGDEYKLIAVDRAGNQSEQVIKVLGDDIPPSDVKNFVLTDRSSKTVNLEWDAATDNVAVDAYVIYRDGKEIKRLDADTLEYTDSELEADKKYEYEIKAVDKAKNYSENATSLSVTTVSPKIDTYFSPADEYIIEQEKQISFWVNSVYNEKQADLSFEFKYKTKGEEEWTSLYKGALYNRHFDGYTLDVAAWDPAEYEFKYIVSDRDKTEDTKTVETEICHDYTDPEAHINAPSEDKLLNKEITIEGYATDDSKMGSISVYAGVSASNCSLIATIENDADVSENDPDKDPLAYDDKSLNSKTVTEFKVPWDTSGIRSGSGYVKIVARDYYGNVNADEVNIKLDNLPPVTPNNVEIFSDDTKITVMWEKKVIEDDLKGFRVYRAEDPAGEFKKVFDSLSYGHFDGVETGILNNKTYYYYVTAYDYLDNESEPSPVLAGRMEVDETNPIVNSWLPGNGKKLCNKETLSIAAYDNYKLAKLEIWISVSGAGEWTNLKSFEYEEGKEKKRDVFTYEWDIKDFEAGKYDVKYVAYDMKGNASEPVILTYEVEEYTLPAAPVVTYEPGFKSISLSWDTSGNESLVSAYHVYKDDVEIKKTGAKTFTDKNVAPGQEYTYKIVCEDKFGATAESEEIPAVTNVEDTEAPVALFSPVNLYTTAGKTITFNASGSHDNDVVKSYEWTFGDGDTASGVSVDHAYSETGRYEVSLKVTDDYGNNATTKTVINVVELGVEDENGDTYQLVTIKAVSSRDGGLLPETSLTISRSVNEDEENTFEDLEMLTDNDGQIVTILPTGNYKINAIHDGYFVATSRIAVLNKDEQVFTVILRDADMIIGTLSATEMTLDEMIAAGIDINDPDNQHVFKFAVEFRFSPAKDTTFKIPINIFKNSAGTILCASGGGGGGSVGTTSGGGGFWFYAGDQKVTVYPATEELFLVIYGEAHWLKEMFDVELVLANSSSVEYFENVEATLSLPEGLSLAKMLTGDQSLTQEFGTIPVNGKDNKHWYVRGDEEGEYDLSAKVTGNSMPNDEEFVKTFKTEEPLKVWAGSALQLTITADEKAVKGQPYGVEFELQNVSTKELYNLSFQITGSEQYVVKDGNKTELEKDEKGSVKVSRKIFTPGEKITYNYTVTISDSDILEHTEYYLKNCFAVTLEGSTTEIPIIFNITKGGNALIREEGQASVIFRVLNEEDRTPVEGAYVYSDHIQAGKAEQTDADGYVRFDNVYYTQSPQYVGVSYEEKSIPVKLQKYTVASETVEYTIYVPNSDDPYVMNLQFKNKDDKVRTYTYFSTAKYAVQKDDSGKHTIYLDINWQAHDRGKVWIEGTQSKTVLELFEDNSTDVKNYCLEQESERTIYSYILEKAQLGKNFEIGEKINLIYETADGKKFVREFPLRIVKNYTETMVAETLESFHWPDFVQTAATELAYLDGQLLGGESFNFSLSSKKSLTEQFKEKGEVKTSISDESITIEIGGSGNYTNPELIQYSSFLKLFGQKGVKIAPSFKFTIAYDEFGYSKNEGTITVSLTTSRDMSTNRRYHKFFAAPDDKFVKLYGNTVYLYQIPGTFLQTTLYGGGSFKGSFSKDKKEEIDWSLKFIPSLKFELNAGYGISDTASLDLVKASITPSAEINIISKDPPEYPITASVTGDIKGGVTIASASVEWQYPNAHFEWQYPDLNKKAVSDAKAKIYEEEKGKSWYLDKKDQKQLNPDKAVAADLPESITLIEDVYKGTTSEIKAADSETTILLLNRQQEDRTPANKMALMYSKATSSEWTRPVLVDPDDKTLTGGFDSAESSSGLWVVYQNMNKEFEEGYGEEELDVADYYSHYEIAVNKYDPKTDTWSGKEMLTNDDAYDFLPVIYAKGDKAIAAWVSADSEKYFNGVHNTTLNYRIFDGSAWGETKKIDFEDIVTALDVVCDGTTSKITYSFLDSEDYTTVQKEITLDENGEIVKSNTDADEAEFVMAGTYFEVNGVMKRAYFAEDSIVVEDAEGSYKIPAEMGSGSLGAAVNGKNAVLYWTDNVTVDEESHNIVWISRFNPSDNTWTDGVLVLTEEGNISGISMILLDDENVAATYLKSNDGSADLCYKVTNFIKPELYIDSEGINYKKETSGSVRIEVPYANYGTKASEGGKISIYSNNVDGTMIGEATIESVIKPGEEGTIKVSIMPQEDTSSFYIVLEDSEGEKTVDSVKYNSTELSIDSAYFASTPGSYDLDMDITNTGITDAKEVNIEVHKESFDGDVVADRKISTLYSGELQHLHIEIPKEEITFDDGAVAYYIVAYEDGAADDEKITHVAFMYKPDDVEITETYTGNAQELSICISNQRAFLTDVKNGSGYHISKNGKDVITTEKWTKQSSVDTFESAIEDAEYVLKMEGATDEEYDDALITLEKARNTFDATFKKGTLVPATDITITPGQVILVPGKTKQLTVKLTSTLAKKHTDSVAAYTSTDEDVATVSNKGLITAVSEGEADITVETKSGLTESVHVIVRSTVMSVTLSDSQYTLVPGCSFTLKGTINPAVKGITIKWISENESVVTVDKNGKVKAVGAGTTNIYAVPKSATEEFDEVKAACTITVLEGLKEVAVVSSTMQLGLNSKIISSQDIITVNGADKDVLTYSSSKPKVASVDQNGVVTAKSAGSTVITVKTMAGKKATCKVTVTQYSTGLSLNASSVSLITNNTYKLKATTTPKKNKDEVIWESNNPSIATVDITGKVLALSEGTAKITATTKHSEIVKTCYVTVSDKVSRIDITGKARKIVKGKTVKLSAKLVPSGSTEKITWESEDETIATVDKKGTVKGISAGFVYIKAVSTSGTVGRYGLTVVNGATKITLDIKKADLAINNSSTPQKIKLVATLTGTDTTDSVTFKSSNKKVATVTTTGLVVAQGKGTATITASTVSGKKAKCKIKVTEFATGVSVGATTVTVKEGKSVTLKATAYSGSITDNRVSNKKVIWKLVNDEDSEYIKIGKNGKITALKGRKTRIALRAYAADGSDVYSTTYVVIR